jgi:hypothetical protein
VGLEPVPFAPPPRVLYSACHARVWNASHLSAWAIVSAPLTLGFDMSDEAKMKAAWPIISNKEVLAVSQEWQADRPHPSGRLVKRWQAKNVPTLAVRGGCDTVGCTDSSVNCTRWAKEKQCDFNPGYMHSHCRKSCGTCDHGTYKGWTFSEGSLRLGDMCVDSEGQLPAGHSGSNVMHTLPCDATKESQKWSFNRTDGPIQNGHGGPCLRVFSTWLWDRPIVDSAGCDASNGERWTLHPNGTLANFNAGCIEVADDSGPPSTIWTKPLSSGRVAVLAINGADMPQTIALDFGELDLGSTTWEARDLWAASDLGKLSSLTREVAPHDCIMLVLSPLADRGGDVLAHSGDVLAHAYGATHGVQQLPNAIG